MVGETFGQWTVMGLGIRKDPSGKSRGVAECRCSCGTVREVLCQSLRSGDSTGCGCTSNSYLRPYEALYNRVARIANQRGCDVLLYEEFLKFVEIDKCSYCLRPLKWVKYGDTNGMAYNLDRMDNLKGYESGNCAACCFKCNTSKGDRYSYQQWWLMTEPYRDGRLSWE